MSKDCLARECPVDDFVCFRWVGKQEYGYWHDDCWQARDKADPVNKPDHYRWLPVEAIDITENFNFNLGNALKYIIRADHKGKPIEDLEKARWFLDRELARRCKDTSFSATIDTNSDGGNP